MSYKYETQHNSPNFTRGADAPKTWGQPYIVRAIAIHWWGDPNTNPTYEGVINTLVNPNRGASAHFVATGTGRRVAQLVNLSDASWATNSANPWTISIECDPRCRNEDYDVVAELIAQIRQVFGKDLPLVPHKQFVATACPGNYDLARLDREAKKKVAKPEFDWGHVENQPVTPPTPPKPTTPTWVPMDNPRKMVVATAVKVRDLVEGKDVGDILTVGTPVEFQTKAEWNGKLYLRSKYSTEKKLNHGILYDSLAEVPVVVEPPVVTPPVTPPVTSPEAPGDGFTENDRNTLTSIQKLVQSIWNALKAIFNIKDY